MLLILAGAAVAAIGGLTFWLFSKRAHQPAPTSATATPAPAPSVPLPVPVAIPVPAPAPAQTVASSAPAAQPRS